MRKLSDGSTVYIRQDNEGYYVEHIAVNGMTADRIDCESFLEARAVFKEHPSNW